MTEPTTNWSSHKLTVDVPLCNWKTRSGAHLMRMWVNKRAAQKEFLYKTYKKQQLAKTQAECNQKHDAQFPKFITIGQRNVSEK